MQYKKLAELYEQLGSTTKRLEKIDILSKFLKNLHESDRDVLYLLNGNIYPEYDEKKIGISNQLVIKAISKATGISESSVVKEWKFIGDLGKVSEKLTKDKKQSTLHSHVLTTEKIISNLRKLPEFEGKGTINKKISLITELLTSASPLEAKYLIRTLIGDLRIGIQESTIREAIADAFFSEDKKNASKKIQDSIDKSNDLAKVFDIARKREIDEFEKISLEVGKPIKVMLAQKVNTIKEGFAVVGKPAAIEYKYDGFRLVVHKNEREIKLFTRRMENNTKQYKPFQSISQRIKRKYDIERLQEELPVEVNVFDIIYYNGKSLLNEPFEKRSDLIKKIVKNNPYKIVHAKQIITDNERKAEEFNRKSLKDNQEGVMMKNLNSVYQPGSRVGYMLKITPEH